MKAGIFNVEAQERVVFGKPAANAVVEEADHYGAVRVFVTSTRSLATATDGPLQRIEKALGDRHVGTFSAISSHSPREDVVAAANAARDAGADLIVAVGGGSVIDATKAVQLCLWMNVHSADEMNAHSSGYERSARSPLTLPADPIRMISVSTTLSASEFTARAGITNTATRTKMSFNHRMMVPRSIILDPAATLGTPEWLLFGTGIRAVDHAVETYCAPPAHPASETLSLRGLELLSSALPRIKSDPSDIDARMAAQFGMWHAIWPISSGVHTGASHGIGYALGAGFGVPHGHTSCVMLPAVMQWNAEVNSERQQALAAAMRRPDRPAFQSVRELVAGLGMPCTLRDVGVKRDDLDELSRRALDYQPVALNPRPIRSEADVREILEIAF
ncbi:MAG: iron-containing alcohol dehydrogenase [Alphaproteobacteria bacterium]|nr:iron-containing alcohol dehydrogenase [Alphaproteobacteria bacterium]